MYIEKLDQLFVFESIIYLYIKFMSASKRHRVILNSLLTWESFRNKMDLWMKFDCVYTPPHNHKHLYNFVGKNTVLSLENYGPISQDMAKTIVMTQLKHGSDFVTWLYFHSLLNEWPRQNDHAFVEDILKYIFSNWNVWISITISLEFLPKVPTVNKPVLVQIMAWRRPGDKPLSEPMMAQCLLMHIFITWHQWVNNTIYQTFKSYILPL